MRPEMLHNCSENAYIGKTYFCLEQKKNLLWYDSGLLTYLN